MCGDGDLELYDEEGTKQTVSFPNGKDYLPTSDIWRKMRFVTVADTTFILNTDITVQATGIPESSGRFRWNPALRGDVFIKKAVASVNYAVYVDGNFAGSTTTSSNTTAGTALEGTAEIAQNLSIEIRDNGYSSSTARGTIVTLEIADGEKLIENGELLSRCNVQRDGCAHGLCA